MINKKKRDEVAEAATALKARIKGTAVPPKPEFTTEFIHLKEQDSNSAIIGIRVKNMSKKITEDVKSVFSKIPMNTIDTEKTVSLCHDLALALFHDRREELKQFKSEPHFFSYYENQNELDILTKEGCDVYDIPLPIPEPPKKVVKKESAKPKADKKQAAKKVATTSTTPKKVVKAVKKTKK